MSAPSLQQFNNYSLDFLVLVLVPVVISPSLYSGKPGFPVFNCLSSLGSNSSSCVFSSLKDPRRVAKFLGCSAFYLLGQSADFKTPYMQNQKPECLDGIFGDVEKKKLWAYGTSNLVDVTLPTESESCIGFLISVHSVCSFLLPWL